MGSPAFGVCHPTDPEPDGPRGQLYCPLVVTMDRQTGRMRTGTGQLMKLKIINNRIVKGLRNLIAIPDKNGYHGIVNRHRVTCGCEQQQARLFQGAGLLFLCDNHYDNTKGMA